MISRYLAIVLVLSGTATAVAYGNRYNITKAEKRACKSDAIRYCAYTYPNQTKLMHCLERKKDQLSDHCRRIFRRGMTRRGL